MRRYPCPSFRKKMWTPIEFLANPIDSTHSQTLHYSADNLQGSICVNFNKELHISRDPWGWGSVDIADTLVHFYFHAHGGRKIRTTRVNTMTTPIAGSDDRVDLSLLLYIFEISGPQAGGGGGGEYSFRMDRQAFQSGKCTWKLRNKKYVQFERLAWNLFMKHDIKTKYYQKIRLKATRIVNKHNQSNQNNCQDYRVFFYAKLISHQSTELINWFL